MKNTVAATAFIFAALQQLVIAHVRIFSPAPIGNPGVSKDANEHNKPLDNMWKDFPCRNQHLKPFSSSVTWKAGEQQQFNILIDNASGASAAHQGGSCQASISTDQGGTWEVMHSYVGNCPRNAEGNNADPTAQQGFKFMLPKDIPAGPAIFAWTWVPYTANREFYMSCAYVNIQNDKPSDPPAKKRPPPFVGDLWDPETQVAKHCGLPIGRGDANLVFPMPGEFVTDDTANIKSSAHQNKAPPTGACGDPRTGGGETPPDGFGSNVGPKPGPGGTSSGAAAPTGTRKPNSPPMESNAPNQDGQCAGGTAMITVTVTKTAVIIEESGGAQKPLALLHRRGLDDSPDSMRVDSKKRRRGGHEHGHL